MADGKWLDKLSAHYDELRKLAQVSQWAIATFAIDTSPRDGRPAGVT